MSQLPLEMLYVFRFVAVSLLHGCPSPEGHQIVNEDDAHSGHRLSSVQRVQLLAENLRNYTNI